MDGGRGPPRRGNTGASRGTAEAHQLQPVVGTPDAVTYAVAKRPRDRCAQPVGHVRNGAAWCRTTVRGSIRPRPGLHTEVLTDHRHYVAPRPLLVRRTRWRARPA